MGLLLRLIQKLIAPVVFFMLLRSLFANLFKAQQYSRTTSDWGRDTGRESGRQSGGAYSSAPTSPYEVLGLPRSATNDEIRARYRQLISKYHPDKFAGLNDPEFTKLAAEKFQKIQSAYEELKRVWGI